ncbi:MAG: hypothetical protein DWP95_02490 [Proteobacteria bacterium]|nr:MAG: hypothetical protein DWP95_02490 [Pseudomonadota bacterium]
MNRKISFKLFLFGSFWLAFAGAVQGATFCISSSAELQAALAIADSNNQADHIKLRFGNYIAPVNGFVYSGFTENYDLEISGNWFTFNNNNCGSRILAGNPFNHSTLDGNNTASALTIIPGASGDISISFVVFTNGNSDDFGGGLRLFPLAEYLGDILIENNVFFDNISEDAGALYVGGGHRVVVRNNLMLNNVTNSSAGGLMINQESSGGAGSDSGIYFTNNTVFENSAAIGHTLLFGGLSVWVEDSSKAFIANNILWGNSEADLKLSGSGYKYLFNNDIGFISGVSADETSGNFSSPPEFEAGTLNFKPALNSSVSNRGKKPPTFTHIPPWFDERWSLGTYDLSGQARVFGTRVDVGAIESDSLSDLIFEDDFE